jgi:clan AA aspartic protease (TIGR02281 family)
MYIKKLIFLSFIFIFSPGFLFFVNADTIYLKNGRSIEGLIKEGDGDFVNLEVCSGSIKFKTSEIERIERSGLEEQSAIREKWERQKQDAEKRILIRQREEESKPKQVEFSQDSQSITLSVTLNKKVEVTLVLDTGASIIMLRRNIAEKLGIDLDKVKPDMQAQLADGRKVDAKHIVLENVKVQNVEAQNIEASILLNDAGSGFGDGLLGMSFLKKFNFKVDHKEKKLILEKL